MKTDLKQALENLPQELLALPRFFKVKANKVPITKGWIGSQILTPGLLPDQKKLPLMLFVEKK